MSDALGLYDREYECPNCGEKFTTKRVKISRVANIRKDTDFCPYYRWENPLFYEVRVCPFCSYAFTDSFGGLNKPQREKLKHLDKVEIENLDYCGERDLAIATASYAHALKVASLIGEKHLIMAGLSMRLAWMYRYADNEVSDRRFLMQGLYHYELAYQDEPIERMGMDFDTMHYLLGELNGRIGRYQESRRWFSKIISNHEAKKALHDLAEDQWQKYNDEMKAAAKSDKSEEDAN